MMTTRKLYDQPTLTELGDVVTQTLGAEPEPPFESETIMLKVTDL
jgi:hypothetical protein